MGLTVESIELSGFGSYGENPQTVKLGGQGPVAIVGDNGAGKSTAVSKALTWCLYGKCAPERMGSGMRTISGKSVLNPECKQARVTVTLTSQTTTYTVVRTRSRKGSDNLEVKVLSGSGWDELEPTEATIESIVGADYFVFTRTVVRGQGDLWSFAEATDKAKRELLDIVSGAFVLESAEVRAVAARKQAEKRADQAGLLADQAQNRLQAKQPEVLKAKSENWEAENVGRIEAARKELQAALTHESEAEAEAGEIAAKESAYKAILDDKPTVDFAPYQNALSQAQNLRKSAENAVLLAQRKVEELEHLQVGHPCPTCGHEVGTDSPIADSKAEAEAARAEAEAEAEEPREHETACQRALTEAREWLNAETEEWQSRLSNFGPVPRSRVADANRLRRMAESKVETLEAAQNPFVLAYENEVKEVLALTKATRGYRAIQEAALYEATIASTWCQALGSKGARAHMAEAALQAIEAEANEWLSVLSAGTLAVEFPATREVKGSTKEDIKTVILSKTASGELESRDLLTYSGGERRRINLAVDLGVASVFSKGGLSLSLLVLDEEVFSGMDEAGKAGVVYALHGAGIEDVVIIDHDPRLSSKLPRTLKVKRGKDGYSEIETCA